VKEAYNSRTDRFTNAMIGTIHSVNIIYNIIDVIVSDVLDSVVDAIDGKGAICIEEK
jgi:hypothetical protein